ncbi:2-oxoglutarate dehydrogenase E1 component, partial [Monoraphidium neglectum]
MPPSGVWTAGCPLTAVLVPQRHALLRECAPLLPLVGAALACAHGLPGATRRALHSAMRGRGRLWQQQQKDGKGSDSGSSSSSSRSARSNAPASGGAPWGGRAQSAAPFRRLPLRPASPWILGPFSLRRRPSITPAGLPAMARACLHTLPSSGSTAPTPAGATASGGGGGAAAAMPFSSSLSPGGDAINNHDVIDALKLSEMIHRFRARGHMMAQLDPLRRCKGGPWVGPIGQENDRSDLTLVALIAGWPEGGSDEERAAFVGRQLGLIGPATPDRRLPVGSLMPGDPGGAPAKEWWGLAEVVEVMRERYCGTLALEFKHLFQQDEMAWIQQRFETRTQLEPEERAAILRQLLEADSLERFLSVKFPSSKRFGLEGCEALLPGLHALIRASAGHGVERIMLGMAHRGRLNVLVHLLGKPIGALCSEMEGLQSEFKVGDVKYHLGQTGSLDVTPPGQAPRRVALSIAPNPSHLEAVNPVVMGMVRAHQ